MLFHRPTPPLPRKKRLAFSSLGRYFSNSFT
jgi:hypothetical protein